MSINAYPLQWPAGWRRTDAAARTAARFATRPHHGARLRDATLHEAKLRVLTELDRMGLTRDDVVLSTNVPLDLGGDPRSDARAPADPGVAVYWQDGGGARRVMAVDRYSTVAGNLAAVAATLDAMRAIERHGGAVVLERAYTGFTALPAPGGSSVRTWREVLDWRDDATPSAEVLTSRFRSLRSERHPDHKGGSDAAMAELNVAYEQACFELGF